MPFGINSAHSLAEIYQYLPTYLEWLIINVPSFEIDINDFYVLPNPTIYFKEKGIKFSRLSHKGSIDVIKKSGKLNEINFTFSEKAKNILCQKKYASYMKEPGYKITFTVNIECLADYFQYKLPLK